MLEGTLGYDTILGGDGDDNPSVTIALGPTAYSAKVGLYGNGGNDYLYGGNGDAYFHFREDIEPGMFDYIGDFNTGGSADALMIPAAFQAATIFCQYCYVGNVTAAQVQAQMAFI